MTTVLSPLLLSLALAGGVPRPGDEAPDFRATALGGRETFVLSKAIAKAKRPIVLVFGSIT